MGVFNISEAFDYNNFIRQVRSLAQDHPQVTKTTPLDPADTGFVVTGTGDGVTYLAAGANMFVGPFQLQCTLGGGDGVATFDVVEDFGGTPTTVGVLTAGVRFNWTDTGEVNELIVRTTTPWVIGDDIDFTTVAGALGAEAWAEDRFVEGSPDGNGDFVTEWLTEGPSIGGGDQINVGMESRFDDPTSRRNIQLVGADGFVGGSDFDAQPNSSALLSGGAKYLYGSNTPGPMWVVVTGDYITGVMNPEAGVYESFFMGFVAIFGTPGNHPKPIMIGGCGSNDVFTVTEIADNGHSAFFDPGEQLLTGVGDGFGSMIFRWVDGLWLNFVNRNTNTSASSGNGKQFAPARWTQPYKSQDATYQITNQPSAAGFDWSEMSRRLIDRPSGRYNLRPIEMFITTPQSAVVGQIPSWKYIPGFNVTVEDTVEDTAPVFNGVVIKNTFRLNRDNFAVLQLDV